MQSGGSPFCSSSGKSQGQECKQKQSEDFSELFTCCCPFLAKETGCLSASLLLLLFVSLWLEDEVQQ